VNESQCREEHQQLKDHLQRNHAGGVTISPADFLTVSLITVSLPDEYIILAIDIPRPCSQHDWHIMDFRGLDSLHPVVRVDS
jgi:hypothetical protein